MFENEIMRNEQNAKIIQEVINMAENQELSLFELATVIDETNKFADKLKPIYIRHKNKKGEKFIVKL